MKEAEELVEAIPYASLRIILDCGHMIPLEQPRSWQELLWNGSRLRKLLGVYPANILTYFIRYVAQQPIFHSSLRAQAHQ